MAELENRTATCSTSIYHYGHRPSASPWLRKPLHIVLQQEHEHDGHDAGNIQRHLSLWDLVSIGVGGTIGSGIFVLAGYIAHHYAGPATAVSFIIAGLCASCNGLCYAELAGRIPAGGSTYVYAYVGMGELPAVVAAACLTLEYAVSGAAVARSWGDKVAEWIVDDLQLTSVEPFLKPGWGLNPMAFIVSAASVALLLGGVQESKRVTTFFTVLKLVLVAFVIVGGFFLFDTSNITPFFVPSLGATGVMRGATSSFFGYLGYDEVCCIAGEAINPERDMPRAVLLTLAIVTTLYVLAAIALVGMQPWQEMSDTSAFPDSFRYNGIEWAAQVAAAGEVICLPVVVVIALMAQPRLQLALAKDGLIPEIFGRLDDSGNLRWGALISGSAMTIIATFVPFGYLDDMISAGILFAFCITNSCLVLMRCDSPTHKPQLLGQCLLGYNILCFVTALLLCNLWGTSSAGTIVSLIFCFSLLLLARNIANRFPLSATFGVGDATPRPHPIDHIHFEAPCVPYLPCAGMFVNWYLIAQLEAFGLLLMVCYIAFASLFYFCYGAKHSVGNTIGWSTRRGDYEIVSNPNRFLDGPNLQQTISLPKMNHGDNR